MRLRSLLHACLGEEDCWHEAILRFGQRAHFDLNNLYDLRNETFVSLFPKKVFELLFGRMGFLRPTHMRRMDLWSALAVRLLFLAAGSDRGVNP